MLNKAEINEIFERLKSENPNPTSELSALNGFTFAVAVLLSAQATDKSVNKATEALFKVANTPQEILSLGIDKLKEYIKTIGLYNNKAKNIIALSQILVDSYNSELPRTRDELEKLPGIGRKSANVISNRLFGTDDIAVDTHVLRVSNRIGLSNSKTPENVEKDLINVIPRRFHKNASDWLVLHGRYVCAAKKPKCENCILFDLCETRR